MKNVFYQNERISQEELGDPIRDQEKENAQDTDEGMSQKTAVQQAGKETRPGWCGTQAPGRKMDNDII